MHHGPQVAETPRLRLRVTRVKACEELLIGELPEAGGVVGHNVGGARDIIGLGQVAVMPLVEARDAEEVGGGTIGGGTATLLPTDGRDIVAQWADGA
jgi:hypothetical protein